MDIENRKQKLLSELQELRTECEILIKRTYAYQEELLKVKTEAEAIKFDETHDIEEGLSLIRLF